MKIIRDKTSNIVTYIFDDNKWVTVTDCMVTKEFKALDINSTTHEIVENVDAIEPFIGGVYSYDTSWKVVNQAQLDEYLATQLQEKKDRKCQGIDSLTANAIVELAGDVYSQANKQAKSSQLIRKEALGTITAEEKELLDYLDNLFLQIEALIVSGNDKEAQIQACTTLAEYEAKCVELGV